MMTPQINLLVIRSHMPAALAKFYELLGMKFKYHRHGNGLFHFSTELDRVVFEIYPLLKGQKTIDKSLRIGFTVVRLDKLMDKLKKEGVKIRKEPMIMDWGYIAIIEDLEGRRIELKEKEAKWIDV